MQAFVPRRPAAPHASRAAIGGRSLTTVEAKVQLEAPVAVVHEALQDASSLPVLLDGVHDVRPLPHATLVLMDGAEPWEVQIVDRSPVHITWDRIDGPGSAEVRLRPAGPRGTKMHVLVYEVDDVDACEKVLQRELGHLQAAIRELASPPVHPWGVAGPW